MMVSLIGNHDTIRSVWPESGGLSLDSHEDDGIRLNRSQATINLIRLRVGVIPLTLSLIDSKPSDPISGNSQERELPPLRG